MFLNNITDYIFNHDGVQLGSRRCNFGPDGQGERPSGAVWRLEHSQQTHRKVKKKLFSIISNPFEQKYRGIKTTNNTIKNKIMNLRRIQELLTCLGFQRENEEMLILRD